MNTAHKLFWTKGDISLITPIAETPLAAIGTHWIENVTFDNILGVVLPKAREVGPEGRIVEVTIRKNLETTQISEFYL